MLCKVGLALSLTLALCLASPAAQAYEFTWDSILKDRIYQSQTTSDRFEQDVPDPGMGWQVYKYVDNVPILAAELITDENLLDIRDFEISSTTIIPVVPVQLYLRYATSSIERRTEEGSRVYKKVPPPGIPFFLKLLTAGPTKVGLVGHGRRKGIPVQRWGVLNFLLMEEGVFSGEEWDLENFLPRVLSVIALVVAALLVIEFLRFLLLVGMKVVSGADKRN
jgi:hypothetical protein